MKKIFKNNEEYFEYINSHELVIEEVRIRKNDIVLYYQRSEINGNNRNRNTN